MSGSKARHTRTKINQECRIKRAARVRTRADFLSFADLVVIAKEFYPIPFRTRPSKPSASMVLRLKPRESRTPPGLPRTENQRNPPTQFNEDPGHESDRGFSFFTPRSRPRIAQASAMRPYAAAMDRSAGQKVVALCAPYAGAKAPSDGPFPVIAGRDICFCAMIGLCGFRIAKLARLRSGPTVIRRSLQTEEWREKTRPRRRAIRSRPSGPGSWR
jgi:hypothetical protein